MPAATRIAKLRAREVLDSRGRPTVEADVLLEGGVLGRASVPSGASTGRHEAVELRDGDPARYGGRGVLRAVGHVEGELADALQGLDAADQAALDAALVRADGSADRGRLGANALLAVSCAGARAAANALGRPLWRHLAPGAAVLPRPMVNLLSGGLHARRTLDLQDFLIVPLAATAYAEALEHVVHVHAACGELLAARRLSTLRADEGGYGPALGSSEAALDLVVASIEAAGLEPGADVAIALDVAATHLHDPRDGRYRLPVDGLDLDAAGVVELIAGWCGRYPIVSVEDVLGEDDWAGWSAATERLGPRVQIVGDDLFTTDAARLARGVESGAANAVLVKMNQIGTVTEALAVVGQAQAAGYRAVVSARSGETEDAFLADLAVASGAGQIKVGSVTGGERLAKYNRLLVIGEELQQHGVLWEWPR